MKTITTTTANKLIDKFDNELKRLLLNDLKAIRKAKNQIINKIQKGLDNNTLSAA
jgi:succinate dehydrogenase flavin-adding protein (antitoxin of CptAB toxin-antitoxin module)